MREAEESARTCPCRGFSVETRADIVRLFALLDINT